MGAPFPIKRTGRIYAASSLRSWRNTGSISGITPCQSRKACAACPTSIPSPSAYSVAPLLRPGQEWRDALLIKHVIATGLHVDYARGQGRDLPADAGRRRIDHQIERLLIQLIHRRRRDFPKCRKAWANS